MIDFLKNHIFFYVGYLLGVSIVAFFAYVIDKEKAKRGAWRIPEKVLILLAFLLGAVGAVMGMLWFNHKTAKMKFRLLVPLALILNLLIFMLFFWDSVQA